MPTKSRQIATVGLLAALQVIVLVAGYYLDVVSISCNVIASFLLCLTLNKGMYKWTVLEYVAVSIITLLVMQLHALPYVLFTGGFTIFTIFARHKGWNKIVSGIIKIVWANVAFYLLYKVFSVVIIDFSSLNIVLPYEALAAIVTLAVFAYDLAIQWVCGMAGELATRLFPNQFE